MNNQKEKNKNPSSVISDFEVTNNQQVKQMFTPSMISLKNLEELQLQYCKELKKLLKNDGQIEKQYNEKIKKEEEEKNDDNENRKKQIFALINKIRENMGNNKFTDNEIKRVIDIIFHYPDIIHQIIKNKVDLTKDILFEVLNNSIEDAIRKLRSFVNDKAFKFDYGIDPTHKNTTTLCLPKSNNTKENEKNLNPNKDDEKNEKKNNV